MHDYSDLGQYKNLDLVIFLLKYFSLQTFNIFFTPHLNLNIFPIRSTYLLPTVAKTKVGQVERAQAVCPFASLATE